MPTPYGLSAKYYDDAYAVKPDLVDLPFYVDLAKQIGGPILEMGCGTGRLLLPIAHAGIEIHGLDNAPAMLTILLSGSKTSRKKSVAKSRFTKETCGSFAGKRDMCW